MQPSARLPFWPSYLAPFCQEKSQEKEVEFNEATYDDVLVATEMKRFKFVAWSALRLEAMGRADSLVPCSNAKASTALGAQFQNEM